MYAGAGSGSLVAAAASWEGLASQLGSAATSYRAVVSDLTAGPWVGPSSVSMAAAAVPYVAWMNTTAAAAEQTASQLAPAIAATEAQYAEMWAQDAAAMYGYAGASAAATTVTPFNPPPPTTNPGGTV